MGCQLSSGLRVGSRSSVSDQGFGMNGCKVEHGKEDRKGFWVISDVRQRSAHDPGSSDVFRSIRSFACVLLGRLSTHLPSMEGSPQPQLSAFLI